MLEQHQIELLQKVAIRIKNAKALDEDFSEDGDHLADLVLLIFGLPNTASTPTSGAVPFSEVYSTPSGMSVPKIRLVPPTSG